MANQSPLIDGDAPEQRGESLVAPAVTASAPSPVSEDLEAATAIGAFIVAFDKAVRARRLYQSNNPVYRGFLASFHTATERLWEQLGSLFLTVDEQVFRWHDRTFAAGEGRESLPFLFYRDGVRYIAFLPGFEEEIEPFLTLLAQARLLDQRADDDIVTLLWQAQFLNFQYTYVDALAEGLTLPEGSVAQAVRPVTQLEPPPGAPPAPEPYTVQQGALPVAQIVSRADFNETLYFLDRSELELLNRELEREQRRDLRGDVLNALFDRLEEPLPERQAEIIRILRQLVPTYLGAGELKYVTRILSELAAILHKNVMGEGERSAAEAVYRELGEPAVLSQLLVALETGSIDPDGAELGDFLEHLGASAMPLLLRSIETGNLPALKERLRLAMRGLAQRHRPELIALLRAESPEVVRGAARLCAQLGISEAITVLTELVRAPNVEFRRVAVEALTQLRSASALEALRAALKDTDRDVRVAAARGLAAANYGPARATLEAVLSSHTLRAADLTEKIAFFEAFGSVAGVESTTLLDRLLNGRRLLKRESPEIRACAAMALGRIGSPAARAALLKASADASPMVRNAVANALRVEGQPS